MVSTDAVCYNSVRHARLAETRRNGDWRQDRGWASASMTDPYGYLTWPGKTHFLRGQPIGPMGAAPDIGPQAPPEESWQVHP